MFFFKKKTSYEMRIIDWSSDVCSSDLAIFAHRELFKAAECRRRHSAALKSSRCAKIACDRKRPRNPNPATKSQPFFDEIRKTVLARGCGGSRVIHFGWVSLNSRSPMGSGFIPASPNLHGFGRRSEEHTSELQSLMRISYAVFCLKKKKKPELNNRATDI